MNLGIIGSTSFSNYIMLRDLLLPYKEKITNIVSGGAPGADTLGAKFCKEELNKEPIIFEAEWYNLNTKPCKIKINKVGKKYNCLAGFNRNTLIVKNSDAVIAFWNGKSPGTLDSINKCRSLGVKLEIIYF